MHNLLQALKSGGRAFGKTHLESEIEGWRPSEKQQQWTLRPSDPTQALEERFQMYFGVLADAVEWTARRKAQTMDLEPDDDGKASIDVSAVEVVEMMIERAKEEPLAMFVLMQLRFDDVIFSLVDAEKTGPKVDAEETGSKVKGSDLLHPPRPVTERLFIEGFLTHVTN